MILWLPSCSVILWLSSCSVILWLPCCSGVYWLPCCSEVSWLPSCSMILWLPSCTYCGVLAAQSPPDPTHQDSGRASNPSHKQLPAHSLYLLTLLELYHLYFTLIYQFYFNLYYSYVKAVLYLTGKARCTVPYCTAKAKKCLITADTRPKCIQKRPKNAKPNKAHPN